MIENIANIATKTKYFYLDELFNNSDCLVTIAISGITGNSVNAKTYFGSEQRILKPMQFFIAGGMSFSGTNQYEAPLENAFNEVRKLFSTGQAMLKELGDVADILKSLPTVQLRTQLQTQLQWINSERKSFTIPVFFVRWRKEQSVTDYIRTLEIATNPSKLGEGASSQLITVAPALFSNNPNNPNNIENGNCGIKVGRWFEADNFVLKSYQLTVGKEYDTDGLPIYAEGSITIEAQRIFDGETVSTWIKG